MNKKLIFLGLIFNKQIIDYGKVKKAPNFDVFNFIHEYSKYWFYDDEFNIMVNKDYLYGGMIEHIIDENGKMIQDEQ